MNNSVSEAISWSDLYLVVGMAEMTAARAVKSKPEILADANDTEEIDRIGLEAASKLINPKDLSEQQLNLVLLAAEACA